MVRAGRAVHLNEEGGKVAVEPLGRAVALDGERLYLLYRALRLRDDAAEIHRRLADALTELEQLGPLADQRVTECGA